MTGLVQPSLVFYARREVTNLDGPREIAAFLDQPLPAYAFLPEEQLDKVRAFGVPLRVLAHILPVGTQEKPPCNAVPSARLA
jgi:hypothetical protein